MMKNYRLYSKLRFTLSAVIIFSFQLFVFGQTSHDVNVTSNIYTPDEITINVGDTVIWTNSQGNHNVNGSQDVFPNNPESFGNSTGFGWVYSHVFTIPGTYDYQCDPHVSFGMFGKVIVEEASMPYLLTVNFTGMTPHVGQELTLYVRNLSTGTYLDTVVVSKIEESFSVESYVIEPGESYQLDFFADHNSNGVYDAPPTDHAWRIETGVSSGDLEIDFAHNTDFTDIFEVTSALAGIADKMNIYPNPVNDELFIQSEDKIKSIIAYTITGVQIQTIDQIDTHRARLPMNDFLPGYYFLKVISHDQSQHTFKILKK